MALSATQGTKPETTPSDHDLVSAAIAAAEAHTDGEILTVVAGSSDSYRDCALQYALLAVMLVPIKIALAPQWLIDFYSTTLLGWNPEWTRAGLMMALFIAMGLAWAIVRLALQWKPLLMALTPGRTKQRRVRRRAVALFRASLEARTRGHTGILIYVSLMEHRAEIVADQAIDEKVSGDEWGEAMAVLIDHVREGRTGQGMAAAVEKVGAVLAQHLPRSADDTNEIPDRLIEL